MGTPIHTTETSRVQNGHDTAFLISASKTRINSAMKCLQLTHAMVLMVLHVILVYDFQPLLIYYRPWCSGSSAYGQTEGGIRQGGATTSCMLTSGENLPSPRARSAVSRARGLAFKPAQEHGLVSTTSWQREAIKHFVEILPEGAEPSNGLRDLSNARLKLKTFNTVYV